MESSRRDEVTVGDHTVLGRSESGVTQVPPLVGTRILPFFKDESRVTLRQRFFGILAPLYLNSYDVRRKD